MKRICLIWSRGRHFSPSLPGDRYLKLSSKSDLRAEISGSIVRYNALAPSPEVLRSISCFYGNFGNSGFWIPFLQNCKRTTIEGVTILVEENIQKHLSVNFNEELASNLYRHSGVIAGAEHARNEFCDD